jgi:iron complex transport system substrate-binding protein
MTLKTDRLILIRQSAVTWSMFSLLALLSFSCMHKGNKMTHPEAILLEQIINKAERFSLEKTDSCTILTIKDPWQGARNIEHVYYLVKKGTDSFHFADSSRVIPVPVKKIICTSTTHIAMIEALGECEAIAGVSGAKYVYNKSVAERIENGTIPDIGYDAGINSELILKIKPDLLIMYGIGGEGAGYTSKLREMGIKVMFDADYLENDPLGKAEWIKLFGALFCKEKISDSIFVHISGSYNSLKEYIGSHINNKPTVLLGLPFKDTWYISPGNSYVSRLIDDAGGDYLWRMKVSSFSMPYSLENVFLRSAKSEYWLNIGSVQAKSEIASFDPRLATITPYKSGKLYNNNCRVSPGGGNDYWESGTMNPQVILKDIACILHPDLFPDYELVYYRKIE